MLLILGLIVVALAAMLVCVAALTRPYICVPAAGAASGVLLALGFEAAVAGNALLSVAAIVPGAVAFGFGLFLTLADRSRRRAEYAAGQTTVAEWQALAERFHAADGIPERRAVWRDAIAMADLPESEVALLFGRVLRGHHADAALRELSGGAR